ncbi:hypothetical protein FN976_28335 [Caenimonas sedimenti]|uniref:UrcA family protein n=1 Tax=Caenimonas sedimenti TaxID=2596921 RepID=A0A562ZDW2_9BURK|nr:hypothetical protein [Caenimonas sedimenti]TWO63997.1 hypothetical protein FN976_28335 [Caenimonas sedimenti]
MQARFLLAAVLFATSLVQAQSQDSSGADRVTAAMGYEVLNAIHKVNGSQESAARRCRVYMEEAQSAEKLGAKDMAARNWDRAARGCRSDAVIACRVHKDVAPGEQCNMVLR